MSDPTAPPSLGELVAGPFRGFAIYPRAARTPPMHALALLVVLTTLAAAILTAQWYFERAGWLSEAEHSALYLMPRVTIAGGEARAAGAPKLYDAVHFLVWLDPTTDSLAYGDVPMEPGELRPLVHVGARMLVVHRRDKSPRPLAWGAVEERYGSLSLDGTEVIEWLAEQLPAAALSRMLAGLALTLAWQLVLLAGLAFLYRVIFYRGLYVPRFGTLVAVGATAAIPAVALAGVVGLSGFGQAPMVVVHAAVLGTLFLAAATRVRLGDDARDRSSAVVDVVGTE
ncbi:MAG: hypothetical protein GY898_09355 [Proteobacteria bacterium]|nr:hypothetical protein [Pseudomonadota bacterium]